MATPPSLGAEERQLLEALVRVNRSLNTQSDRARLVETVLMEARALANADGGTLYLLDDSGGLCFEIMHNETLGIHFGGTAAKTCTLPPVPLRNLDGTPNLFNLASRSFWTHQALAIDDVYAMDPSAPEVRGVRAFDTEHDYKTISFLTIPLMDASERVLGVVQLVNARSVSTNDPIPFGERARAAIDALASLAAITLENRSLLEGQRVLLESFIRVLANAIDAKSPYTGAHCARVPLLTEMLTRAACQQTEGPFAAFQLTDAEWYELRIAAWMHDCGKVATPSHVMDKATKLEAIFDRVELLSTRVEVLIRDAQLRAYEQAAAGVQPLDEALEHARRRGGELREMVTFLRRINVGAEFLRQEDRARILELSKIELRVGGQPQRLISEDELEHLLVERGTLTERERRLINGHMVHTVDMLEGLPFPPELARVPEYATGHHERMDGGGYPRGVHAGTMSIPARVMAIADTFEALTAADRPYKSGKTLSESLSIMGEMKRNNHIDPELFDLFIASQTYLRFARQELPRSQVDEIDEGALLAIRPLPLNITAARTMKDTPVLPEYDELRSVRRSS